VSKRAPASRRRPGLLLTVEEAADILNVSPAYVRRRLVFERRLTYIKVGRHLRIDESDLQRFIDNGRVSAARYKGSKEVKPHIGETWPTSDA
jgi:excisionase family DNA binding protein